MCGDFLVGRLGLLHLFDGVVGDAEDRPAGVRNGLGHFRRLIDHLGVGVGGTGGRGGVDGWWRWEELVIGVGWMGREGER